MRQFYPLVNDPVKAWQKSIKWRPGRGAGAGATYLESSRKMRGIFKVHSKFLKDLGALDQVIWAKYGKK